MRRNFTVSFLGICTVLLFVGCSNQVEQPDKFERAVKCRELAEKYLKKEPVVSDRGSSLKTVDEVIYSESRNTCLAKVRLIFRVGELVSSTDTVVDILTNRNLAVSGKTGNTPVNWYYNDNYVQHEADEQAVKEVMNKLMRE